MNYYEKNYHKKEVPMKIITIVEDNSITGIKYGTVEIPEHKKNTKLHRTIQKIKNIQSARNAAIRAEKTKHK